MKGFIGLDFETFGDVDLTVHGLERYVKGQHFTPLIAATVERVYTAARVTIFDFVTIDYDKERQRLVEELEGKMIVAHNAGFEQAVLRWMGIDVPSERFIDSAVLARAAGAAGKLEAAAPQLLGVDKVAAGWDLIKLFSIPGKYQEANGNDAFDVRVVEDNGVQWQEFFHYCIIDAKLSLQLAELLLLRTSRDELANNAVTMDMNKTGWHVDVDLVRNMQLRYLTNVANAEAEFREVCDAPDLNLNSSVQLKNWCAERGVRATSFDEAHVERMLNTIRTRLTKTLASEARARLEQVKFMLETKQVMGGSSLKKLQTILDTTSDDGRLRDQYLHCGAGATYRTTGRGVQMQNLKRLNGEGNDMSELWVEDTEWDNTKLAANLRQVFTASHPAGFLIVGDFSSVESRGLAWQAGEQWKLDAYFRGEDLYKVQAAEMFHKPVAQIGKSERQIGKVGELACGYGAGAQAVKDFAAKMGVELSEGESAKLVADWRKANPLIVDYWARLHEALLTTVTHQISSRVELSHGYYLRLFADPAPQSLRDQVKDQRLISLEIRMVKPDDRTLFSRVIHGTHIVGRNIHYWKPSERKTGDLWVDTWTNPKTKRQQPFTVYGGKLSGLLTQSLCREVFFASLRDVHSRLDRFHGVNVQLVGQFHDEIVLDWSPGALSLEGAKDMLQDCMTRTILPRFPLAAEIKHDFRYTK